MSAPVTQLVVFSLKGLRCALHLAVVGRIERAVAVSPLPRAPEIVLGVINVRGRVFPVVDLRKRFRLPSRPIDAGDRLILASTSRRPVALLAEEVEGVESFTADRLAAEGILPGLACLDGVIPTHEGIIFIHNLDRLLSLEEEERLRSALEDSP
jgi:purine-binding chemotaxis protein CheW